MTLLGLVVVRIDLGPELHLLEPDLVVLALSLLLPLQRFELEAPVVHEPADRGLCLRRNLDQV